MRCHWDRFNASVEQKVLKFTLEFGAAILNTTDRSRISGKVALAKDTGTCVRFIIFFREDLNEIEDGFDA